MIDNIYSRQLRAEKMLKLCCSSFCFQGHSIFTLHLFWLFPFTFPTRLEGQSCIQSPLFIEFKQHSQLAFYITVVEVQIQMIVWKIEFASPNLKEPVVV